MAKKCHNFQKYETNKEKVRNCPQIPVFGQLYQIFKDFCPAQFMLTFFKNKFWFKTTLLATFQKYRFWPKMG